MDSLVIFFCGFFFYLCFRVWCACVRAFKITGLKLQVKWLKELFQAGGVTTELVFISSCSSEKSGHAFVEAGVPHVVAVKVQERVTGESEPRGGNGCRVALSCCWGCSFYLLFMLVVIAVAAVAAVAMIARPSGAVVLRGVLPCAHHRRIHSRRLVQVRPVHCQCILPRGQQFPAAACW